MIDESTRDPTGRAIPHNSRDTSIAAARKAATFASPLRKRACGIITDRKLYGATCENVEDDLRGHSHQSISARLWELAQDDRIFDSMHRRPNRSQIEAIVWIASEVVPEAIRRPYIEYQRAQFALEVLRKTLSNLDRAIPYLDEEGLGLMADLKGKLTEQKHLFERIVPPPPLSIYEATAPSTSSTLVTSDGKSVLL